MFLYILIFMLIIFIAIINQSKMLKGKSQPQTQSPTKIIKQQQLKSLILQYQNSTQKGYYTFPEWKTLHSQLFSLSEQILTSTVINAWRILKLINFGDDFVPTGLIFDTLVTVINVQRSVQEAEYLLKSIFFKFIEFNGKYLTEKEREELAFFRVVRSVVEGYRKLVISGLSEQQQQHQSSISLSSRDRNEQLYKLHNVFTYKKNLSALKRIQEQFKQCTFEPATNTKSSQLIQSRYLSPKTNPSMYQSEQLIGRNVIQEEEQEDEGTRKINGFRASPVPDYPQIIPNGLNQHLERMQKSRDQARVASFRPHLRNSSVSEFSLSHSSSLKAQHCPESYKLLFLIKVEIGKRVYRIKVRENMGIKEVVQNIEKMAGFKDQGIEEIVTQYFLNWEKRKSQTKKTEQFND